MKRLDVTDEEHRIIIVALAGFVLDDDERKTIRPLYMRMIRGYTNAPVASRRRER